MKMIEALSDKPWDWIAISENPYLTMEIIEVSPYKPWDWRWISNYLFGWT
jgi:hypothetical protein